MAINLKGRSFLTLEDFTPAEIQVLAYLGCWVWLTLAIRN